jgi:hypothetical protein
MDLSGVPLSERDLFEKNEEMIRRLLDRQLELMELKEDLPKTDQIGRKKLQKEYGKINRWLGDLYQAPETYADINMEGATNKQLGERIHTHTRRVMDQWALDNRPAKQGGSSIHHGDSTMQTLGAVRTAPTGIRRDIIAAVKDQGKELATGLTGRNFFDVSEETHPLYHPGEGGKVDYKNKLAAISELPSTATLDERVAAITKSTDISTAASEAADASPLAQARQADLLDRARSTGGGEVLDAMGNPFDRSNPLRTTDNIAALRKHINLSFKGGGVTFNSGFGVQGYNQLKSFLKGNIGSEISGGLYSLLLDGNMRKAVEDGDTNKIVETVASDVLLGGLSGEVIKGVVSRLPVKLASVAAKVAPVLSNAMPIAAVSQLGGSVDPKVTTNRNIESLEAQEPAAIERSQFIPQQYGKQGPGITPKGEVIQEPGPMFEIKDPLNELQYAGKQIMSFFGGALRMGSQAGF